MFVRRISVFTYSSPGPGAKCGDRGHNQKSTTETGKHQYGHLGRASASAGNRAGDGVCALKVCLRLVSFSAPLLLVRRFARASFTQNEFCQDRTVPFSVYHSEGRTIHGLTPSDFEAKFYGQPVKILSIVPYDRPHRVVILLDASGNMAHVWKPALAAASDLAETPLPNVQVALIVSCEPYDLS